MWCGKSVDTNVEENILIETKLLQTHSQLIHCANSHPLHVDKLHFSYTHHFYLISSALDISCPERTPCILLDHHNCLEIITYGCVLRHIDVVALDIVANFWYLAHISIEKIYEWSVWLLGKQDSSICNQNLPQHWDSMSWSFNCKNDNRWLILTMVKLTIS